MWKLGIGTLLIVATQAYADGIEITEQPHHVSEGRVILDATPAEIYDLVTSYGRWRTILSDIRSVTVESGDRDHARVRFSSRALEHTVTVQFDNVPGRSISFRGVKGPPGGRASGNYQLVPVDGGKRTQVIAKLYMDVVGAPSLFVRDKTIRNMRRAKLQADLSDMSSYFAARKQTSKR